MIDLKTKSGWCLRQLKKTSVNFVYHDEIIWDKGTGTSQLKVMGNPQFHRALSEK